MSSLIGLQEPDDKFEEYALAGTAEADDRRDLPLKNLQIDVFKDGLVPEGLPLFLVRLMAFP